MNARLRRPTLALAGAVLALSAAPAAAQVVRLPATDSPLAGQATPLFTIGAEEGESWEMLSNVRSLGFDRAENLYVLDMGGKRVLQFDRTGRFVRQIGSEGQGPGELSVPISMSVAPDGRVVVLDLGKMGYSIWRPDGTFDRSVAVEGFQPIPSSGGIGLHPSGGIVQLMRTPLNLERATSGDFQTTHAPLVYVPLTGAPRKFFDVPQASNTSVSGTSNQRMVMMTPPPRFSPQAYYGMLPDGNVALSFTSGYTIRIVDTNGRTLRYLQRAIAPRPVTAADRSAAEAEMAEMRANPRNAITITRGNGPQGGQRMGAAAAGLASRPLEFADSMSVVQQVLTTNAGRVWVRRAGPSGQYADGPIDILDPAGRYLGTLRGQKMPRAVSAAGRAAYVETDDDGVERVVVRQLPAGWR